MRHVIVGAAAVLLAAGAAPAQETPAAPGVLRGVEVTEASRQALAAYENAIDLVRQGNEAQKRGDSESAYCRFAEAVFLLEEIRENHPEWRKEMVARQIENITKVRDTLTAAECKLLGEMKEDRFRLQVWEQQARILDGIDRLSKRLDRLENEYWRRDQEDMREILDIVRGFRVDGE
ncbi:MAG: hypothetical protein PHN82_11450 [bacterium]|nr:hypothetical protein [bacterium]